MRSRTRKLSMQLWAEYKKATALETLMGYLYLTGQEERVLLLIQKGMDILETQKMN